MVKLELVLLGSRRLVQCEKRTCEKKRISRFRWAGGAGRSSRRRLLLLLLNMQFSLFLLVRAVARASGAPGQTKPMPRKGGGGRARGVTRACVRDPAFPKCSRGTDDICSCSS